MRLIATDQIRANPAYPFHPSSIRFSITPENENIY
jgi:hypothetical protein